MHFNVFRQKLDYLSFIYVLQLKIELVENSASQIWHFTLKKIPMYCTQRQPYHLVQSIQAVPVPRHIMSIYHFIKEQLKRFKYLVKRLGMRCLTLDELEVLTNESA
ncbi:hypothetical protein Tco_0969114 [Tanacetum coccineum]